MRYRAKPVEIEAVQWTGDNRHELESFAGRAVRGILAADGVIEVVTGEGVTVAERGFYIVRDSRGLFYPCHPEVFEAKYDAIGEGDQ